MWLGQLANELLKQFTKNKTLPISFGDSPSIDGFGRSRTSEPQTLFDSKQLHDNQPLFWSESLGGSATSVHSPANARTRMSVTSNSTDFVIRQSKQRPNYQPGKGQLEFITFRAPQSSGVVCQVGCFSGTGVNFLDPQNGVYFECNSALSWNIAKDGGVTESVDQDQWNKDKLDGSGPSGKTLDMDACQIAIIDFEWLGVGRVRVGFVIDGLVIYCHEFNHANDPTFDSVYMSTPNLPIRYTIQASGTNDAGDLDHICSTVISEGGQEKTGVIRAIDTGFAHVDMNADEPTAVKGFRLKATHLDVTVIAESISIINENNDDFYWALCLNPTYSGGSWDDAADSAIQEYSNSVADNVTDFGLKLASGYASTDTQQTNQGLSTALNVGSEIDGTPEEILLVITALSNGADIQASINYRELL